MSEPLEELRAQRDLIRKHLNWLDAQIASAELPGDEPPAESPKLAQTPDEGPAKVTTAPIKIETEAPPAEATTEPIQKFDELTHAASNGSDVKRAQIGCFVFFVLLTLLFLFFLFGLPYLI